jgi:hypothetical protein
MVFDVVREIDRRELEDIDVVEQNVRRRSTWTVRDHVRRRQT